MIEVKHRQNGSQGWSFTIADSPVSGTAATVAASFEAATRALFQHLNEVPGREWGLDEVRKEVRHVIDAPHHTEARRGAADGRRA